MVIKRPMLLAAGWATVLLLGLANHIEGADLLLPPGATYYPPSGGTLVLDEQYGSNYDGLGSWVQNTGTITQDSNSITVAVSGNTWSYLNLGTLKLDTVDHVIDMGLVGWNTTNWATLDGCWSGVWEINSATGTGWRTSWVMRPDPDYGIGQDVPGGVLSGKNAPGTGIKVPEDTVTVLRFDGRTTPQVYRDAGTDSAGTSGEWNGGSINWLKLYTGGGVAHSNWTIAWIKIYACVESDRAPLSEPPSDPPGPRRCGDEGTFYLPGDVYRDCYVNWHDLKVFTENWLLYRYIIDPINYEYRALPLDGGGALQCVSGSPHNPCLVIVGVDVAGMFRSTDGGQSWTMANDGLVSEWDYAVADVAFAPSDPNRVYAATGKADSCGYLGHLAVSNDAGQTWTIKGTNLAFGGHFGVRQKGKIIVVDDSNPNHLWVGTAYTVDGVMESTDGGDSWTSRGPENIGVIYVLMADPEDPFTLYAGAGDDQVKGQTGQKGLWKSTDGGQSWTKVYNNRVCDMAISSNGRIIVCGDGDKSTVQSSMDGGSSWSTFNAGLPADGTTTYDWRAIAADPKNPGRFIIAAHTNPPGDHPKVYHLSEPTNWTAIDSNLPGMYTTYGTPGADGWQGKDYWFAVCPTELEFHPGVLDKVYVTTWYTIDVSTDGGVTWAARNKGLRTTCAYTQALVWSAYEANYVYFGYADVGAYRGTVSHKYGPGQMSVQSLGDTVIGSNAIPCQFSYDGNTITLFSGSLGAESRIYRRVNYGNWTCVCNNITCDNPTASSGWTYFGAHPTSGLVFARLADMMVILSPDGGESWDCYSDDIVTTDQQKAGNVSPIIYDAGRNKWRVDVNGTDYEADSPGGFNRWSIDPHPDWVVHPANPQLIYRIQINEPGSQNELYRSTDGGTNWTSIFTYGWVGKSESGLTNVTLTSNPNILYVDWYPNWAGSSIATSIDTGDTWTTLPQIPGYKLMSIYPSPWDPQRFIFSSHGLGFWQAEIVLPGDIIGYNREGPDGHVDLHDLAQMSLYWLQCTDPQDPNCTE